MTSLTDCVRWSMSSSVSTPTYTPTPQRRSTAATGGVLDEITVEATADGYAQLVEFADEHAALRVWAIEGHRRPWRRPDQTPRARRGGRDRARPTRTRQAPPRSQVRPARRHPRRPRSAAHAHVWRAPRSGGDRQALSVLLAARRSAVDAATDAQRQLFSLVIAAPEPIRAGSAARRCPP